MNSLPYLDSSTTVRLTLTLVHFLWQGVLVALISAAIVRGMRQASANARYVLYVASLLLMGLCIPMTYMAIEVDTPALVPSPGLDIHLDAFETPGAGYLITNDPPGAEYTINLAVVCGMFLLIGPGAISLDAMLF